MASILRKADLFSRPFQFSIGEGSTNRQTIFGGGLSIGIISISVIYLGYLMNMYFGNKLLPKASKEVLSASQDNSQSMIESLFRFKMIMLGKPWQEFEAKKGKRYLEFDFTYERYWVGHGYTIDILPKKMCEGNKEFETFVCLDYDNMTDRQRTLTNDPSTMLSTQFGINVKKCVDSPDCADPADIDYTMNQINTYLVIYTGLQRYNTTNNAIETNYILDYLSMDSGLFMSLEMTLQKSFTTVQSGLIIQSDETYEHLIDYTRKDTFRSIANSVDTVGYIGYAYVGFFINQYYQVNRIQYPQVTEILTQFTSVFSILFVLGFFANRIADLDIFHEIADIWLKEYFKQTALHLIDQQKVAQEAQGGIKPNKRRESYFLTDRIALFRTKVATLDFLKRPFKYAKVSIFRRISMILFGSREAKNQVYSDKEIQIYNELVQFTSKKIDVREVYRDIIKIKMAIKFMLTEEQYAAIHFCGRDIMKQLQESTPSQAQTVEKIDVEVINRKDDYQLQQQQISQGGDDHQLFKSAIGIEEQILPSSFSPQNQSVSNLTKQEQQPLRLFSPISLKKLNAEEKSQTALQIISRKQKNSHKIEQKHIEQNESIKQKKKNHLESIDEIEAFEDKRVELLDRFLKRLEFQEGTPSQIDKNIYSALINNNLKKHPLDECILL